jgi:cupin 2 domain-containing protein
MINIFFEHHQYFLLIFLLIMAFLAGFVDAVAGGGGLISIPALLYTDMSLIQILATNKLQSCVGTGVSAFKYYRSGLICMETLYKGLFMGSIGVISGNILLHYLSDQFMQYLVPVLLVFVFLLNLFNKNFGIQPKNKKMSEQWFFALFGFILGFYDAFFGPGVGNLWVIAIVFFLGYTFVEASGYAKILNLKSNLFALALFLYAGNVNFFLGGIMSVGQVIGGYVGSHTVITRGSKFVRPFFLVIIFTNMTVAIYNLLN